jgi:SAM-dependent methyltransferase
MRPYLPVAFLRTKEYDLGYYQRISKEIENIINYFGVLPGKLEFLDFGMGWGHWCHMAGAYGCIAIGFEISQSRINYANSVGIKTVKWENIPDRRFDFINTQQVFEHVDKPFETLVHLRGSLKPKGIIRICVPDGSDIKRRLQINDWMAAKGSQNSLNSVAPLEHLNCYSYESLVYMADLAGLIPIEMQGKTNSSPPKIIDTSIRDIIRPFYKRLFSVIPKNIEKGTNLLFKRKTSSET